MQTTMDCNDIYNGLQLPQFNLQDLNPNSSSYNYNINPESFPGIIRLFYFSSNENWGTCINRFGSLNDLFIEYQTSVLEDIMIIGIGGDNNIEVENMVSGNILPWVKDNELNNVWSNWNVSNRDLFFIDKQGNYSYKINISSSFDSDYIKSIIDCIEWCL